MYKNLFNRNVLIVCLTYGLVFFYDLDTVIKKIGEYQKENLLNDTSYTTLSWYPIVSLKVPES